MENKNYEHLIPKMKERFKHFLDREPDFNNPIRFTDKLEYMKVYDNIPLKTLCADKLLVREYVKDKLKKDISLPIIGIYEKFKDIDFKTLPSNFVIKTNHGSHTNIIVKNGKYDRYKIYNTLKNWLSKDWSWWAYEFHYIPIKKKIFIEKFIDAGKNGLTDYKFYCFNGNPIFCQVINGRNAELKTTHFDLNWNYCPEYEQINHKPNPLEQKPKNFELMIDCAKKLSADFKFVRVDLYEIFNKIYFSELTFYPNGGYLKYKNDDIDFTLGNLLQI